MNVQPKFSENDQLAEESDKSWGQSLVTALDGKANKSDLLTAIAHVNAKTGQEDLLKAIQALSTIQDIGPLIAAVNALAQKTENNGSLIAAINTVANKIDSLKAGVIAACTKLDADTGVDDTDYAATVAALLV